MGVGASITYVINPPNPRTNAIEIRIDPHTNMMIGTMKVSISVKSLREDSVFPYASARDQVSSMRYSCTATHKTDRREGMVYWWHLRRYL